MANQQCFRWSVPLQPIGVIRVPVVGKRAARAARGESSHAGAPPSEICRRDRTFHRGQCQIHHHR